MRHSAENLRELATAARTAADKEQLANAKMKHLAAAEKWEKLALQAEALSANRLGRADIL